MMSYGHETWNMWEKKFISSHCSTEQKSSYVPKATVWLMWLWLNFPINQILSNVWYSTSLYGNFISNRSLIFNILCTLLPQFRMHSSFTSLNLNAVDGDGDAFGKHKKSNGFLDICHKWMFHREANVIVHLVNARPLWCSLKVGGRFIQEKPRT